MDPQWYKDAVIYELHVKSFCDSNDDGIGDFQGLIQKLDYLQELGGHRRTRRFFAISSPFGGTFWSHLYPGLGAAQMAPGSAFLAQLDQTVDLLDGIALYSFWTPFDLVIVPPTSSVWPPAENISGFVNRSGRMRNSRSIKAWAITFATK